MNGNTTGFDALLISVLVFRKCPRAPPSSTWEGGRAALRRFARGSALALLVLTLLVRFRFSRSRSLHLLVLCGSCAPSCF